MIILLYCTLIAPQLRLMKCELCLKIILEQPETLDSSFQGFVCGTDLRTFYWSVSWTGTNQLCTMHLFIMIIVPILLSTSTSSSSLSSLWLSSKWSKSSSSLWSVSRIGTKLQRYTLVPFQYDSNMIIIDHCHLNDRHCHYKHWA